MNDLIDAEPSISTTEPNGNSNSSTNEWLDTIEQLKAGVLKDDDHRTKSKILDSVDCQGRLAKEYAKLEDCELCLNDEEGFNRALAVIDKAEHLANQYRRKHKVLADYLNYIDDSGELQDPTISHTTIGGEGELRVTISSTPCEHLNELLTKYVNDRENSYVEDVLQLGTSNMQQLLNKLTKEEQERVLTAVPAHENGKIAALINAVKHEIQAALFHNDTTSMMDYHADKMKSDDHIEIISAIAKANAELDTKAATSGSGDAQTNGRAINTIEDMKERETQRMQVLSTTLREIEEAPVVVEPDDADPLTPSTDEIDDDDIVEIEEEESNGDVVQSSEPTPSTSNADDTNVLEVTPWLDSSATSIEDKKPVIAHPATPRVVSSTVHNDNDDSDDDCICDGEFPASIVVPKIPKTRTGSCDVFDMDKGGSTNGEPPRSDIEEIVISDDDNEDELEAYLNRCRRDQGIATDDESNKAHSTVSQEGDDDGASSSRSRPQKRVKDVENNDSDDQAAGRPKRVSLSRN